MVFLLVQLFFILFMKEVSAGVIIYRQSEAGPKFLLLYHGNGYWNFPKGKLESDERSFRTALREAKEETGIRYRDLRFQERFRAYDRYVFMRHGDKVYKLVVFYLAESTTDTVRISEEHSGYGWFLRKDAVKIARHDNLKRMLKMAYDTLCDKGLRGSKKDSPRTGRDLQTNR